MNSLPVSRSASTVRPSFDRARIPTRMSPAVNSCHSLPVRLSILAASSGELDGWASDRRSVGFSASIT